VAAARPAVPAATRYAPDSGGFHLAMALCIIAIVAAGFGRTVDARLIHPPSPRPWILYLHATLNTSWVLLFAAQAALVRWRKVAWHRRLGLGGIAVGALLPFAGFATAVVMSRLENAQDPSGAADNEAGLVISLFDMLVFATAFWLAVRWRRRPDYHRRLMLMATCALTGAAFARFPEWLVPPSIFAFYGGVDALILAAALRDWLRWRQVHPVYRYGLPALVLGQGAAIWILLSAAPAWMALARVLLR
jgi:hypothetical protein